MKPQEALVKSFTSILKRKSIKLDEHDLATLVESGVKMDNEDIAALTDGVSPELVQRVNENIGVVPPSPNDHMEIKEYMMDKVYDKFPAYQEQADTALKKQIDTLDEHYKTYTQANNAKKAPLTRALSKFVRHAAEIMCHEDLACQIMDWKDILSEVPEHVQDNLKLTIRIKRFMERPVLPTGGTMLAHYTSMKRAWDEIAGILSPTYGQRPEKRAK